MEIGPGPGLTTDLLRQRVPRLTAVEADATLAVPLRGGFGAAGPEGIIHVIAAPSSDSPYRKKSGDRSLRERRKRRPGKPGDSGATMSLVDDPDETIDCPPLACCGCGADLAGTPVAAERRHQVTDISAAPATTEYVAQAKECAGCGTVTAGELPAHVRACASNGPETCAQAADLVSGHYIPISRATLRAASTG